MTVIAITMAGAGSRFQSAGYTCPKYEIEVHGKTLFEWSLLSLQNMTTPETEWIFVCLSADNAAEFIQKKAANLGIGGFSIINLETLTDGQATSALYAAEAAEEQDAAFIVYNIDTLVLPACLTGPSGLPDGWIPCIRAEGEHWSFVRCDTNGTVLEVREKQRISPHATIGLYYFSSASLYRSLYHKHFDSFGTEKGERYIAPMYNSLIHKNGLVSMSDLPVGALYPLGTPEEVDHFRKGAVPDSNPDSIVPGSPSRLPE